MNELIAMRLLVAILSLVIVGMATGGFFTIKAWKQTAKSWQDSYEGLRDLIAEPMEKMLAMCVECPDGINCSGCKRFSKYCKKCTTGGG